MTEVTVDHLQASVGKEIGVSGWITVEQSRIDRFAEVTEDRQFIHIDPVRARETPFGGTIAHGFLTVSLLSAMAYEVIPALKGSAMSVNYGFDKLRFITPVPAGSRVRGRFKLKSVTRKSPEQVQLDWAVTVEIEGRDKPALVADWITMQLLAA